MPHFQLVVGGQWTNNAGSYGLAIGAVPSKRVPEIVKRLTERFAKERQGSESFADFANRIGKKTIRAMVEELQILPTYDQDPSYYSDWGDPREYTISDMGEGECAGEVVPLVEVELAAAERELFESQILLDEKQLDGAGARAFSSMLIAARALVKEKNANIHSGTGADEIVAEFRKHYYDTQLFFDPFAGPKFAQYFFRAHDAQAPRGNGARAATPESVHQLIEEATLFVDAAHQCYTRLGSRAPAPPGSCPGLNLARIAAYDERAQAPTEDLPDAGLGARRRARGRHPGLPPLDQGSRAARAHRSTSPTTATCPRGPGVVLIGHGSDYFIDEGEGRLGLLHNRKRVGPRGGRAPRATSRGGRCTPRRCSRRSRRSAASSRSRPTSSSSASTIGSRRRTPTRRSRRRRQSSRRWGSSSSRARASSRAWAARRSCSRCA